MVNKASTVIIFILILFNKKTNEPQSKNNFLFLKSERVCCLLVMPPMLRNNSFLSFIKDNFLSLRKREERELVAPLALLLHNSMKDFHLNWWRALREDKTNNLFFSSRIHLRECGEERLVLSSWAGPFPSAFIKSSFHSLLHCGCSSSL